MIGLNHRQDPIVADDIALPLDTDEAVIHDDVQVRRLTPLERERLQGFPDGWTAMCSNSARNAQTGNAVTVPVVEWIGARLMAALQQESVA